MYLEHFKLLAPGHCSELFISEFLTHPGLTIAENEFLVLKCRGYRLVLFDLWMIIKCFECTWQSSKRWSARDCLAGKLCK